MTAKAEHIENVEKIIKSPSFLYTRPESQRALAEAVVWLLERTPSDEDLKKMAKKSGD